MKLDELPSPPSSSSTAPPPPSVEQLLARPPAERAREFKYRFAQSLVFGLPVAALHWLGPMLGGAEAPKWTGLFQTLLAGWVMYVAAAGMIFEGALLLVRGRLTLDFVVAMVAAIAYLLGAAGWLSLLISGATSRTPVPFHFSVTLLAAWCGVRWAWLSCGGAARATDTYSGPPPQPPPIHRTSIMK